ncbi:polysaccharide deacetylase [Clostridiales bacterium oral taxon 876 str. F0540]|nr:polysaccharide deacetylase [Clostridiales bacterium oral taxon 876 str. F0540]
MKFQKDNIFINTTLATALLIFSFIFSMFSEVKANMINSKELNRENTIYLTFDDGPSNIVTDRILDILKQNGVKATFFVIGGRIHGKEKVLKRIANEGHSIGLHSYTHDYKRIYSSSEVFIKEMDDTQYAVKKVTGITSNIIRFPSGSKSYLNKNLLNKLHRKNYRVYDWNAALSDGLYPHTTPTMLLKESIKVYGRDPRVILLMHCDDVNANTCSALPKIIAYYKQKGYVFKVISNTTSEFYF